MTERLADHGHVTAIEPSVRAAKRLLERFADDDRIDVVCGSLRECEALDYDAAVLVNVLEHVGDDVGLLQEIGKHLRPGGTIVVFVPAHDWLYSDFDRRIGHRRRHRLTSLLEVMDRAGPGSRTVEVRQRSGRTGLFGGCGWPGCRRPRGPLAPTNDWCCPPLRGSARPNLPFGQSLLAVGRVSTTRA